MFTVAEILPSNEQTGSYSGPKVSLEETWWGASAEPAEVSAKPVSGQSTHLHSSLAISAFFITYLVKLLPSQLLGGQRDYFVARCGRTMT